ncbi:hypothetical protein [Methylobacter sp.]|uniref:hypothetical protein n=1 Tax=Methylobacter sp. TaxID=2051955 RepID=UPI002FDD440C
MFEDDEPLLRTIIYVELLVNLHSTQGLSLISYQQPVDEHQLVLAIAEFFVAHPQVLSRVDAALNVSPVAQDVRLLLTSVKPIRLELVFNCKN